jgi:hypothetical protein
MEYLDSIKGLYVVPSLILKKIIRMNIYEN